MLLNMIAYTHFVRDKCINYNKEISWHYANPTSPHFLMNLHYQMAYIVLHTQYIIQVKGTVVGYFLWLTFRNVIFH